MNKREFQALLDRSGSSLMKAAADLDLSQSTVSRWSDEVPGYAQWYAVARTYLSSLALAEIDARFRKPRKRTKPSLLQQLFG